MFEILFRLKSTVSKLGKRLNNPNAGMEVILLSFNSSLFVVFGKSIGISRERDREGGKKTRLGLASYCGVTAVMSDSTLSTRNMGFVQKLLQKIIWIVLKVGNPIF